MVSHGVRAKSGPGRPLAPATVRAAVLGLAAIAIGVVAARTGPTQFAVDAPLVGLFTLVAAVGTGLRLLSDRGNGALSWGLGLCSVVLLGLSRTLGVATGSDVTSVVVFPLAILCLAAALVTLPRAGVAVQPSESSLPRLTADALVACFAVL